MPNSCQNKLTIQGPLQQRQKFLEENQTDVQSLTLENAVPEPLEGDPRRIGSDEYAEGWDWSTWRRANWGTKRDVYDVAYQLDDDLVYVFKSKDTPPLEAIKRISMAYPLLEFSLAYVEGKMCYYGAFSVQDERILKHFEAKYDYQTVERDQQGAFIQTKDLDLEEHLGTYGFKL